MRKSTKEIREYAVSLYKQGNSAQRVANIVAFNEATIRKWLKDASIEIKHGGVFNKKYSNKISTSVLELYETGICTTQIDLLLNLRRGASVYILNKFNIKMRHRGPKSKIEKEDFFDEIDSEEKAYFLGFILADANVSVINGQYSLKFHIAYKDKEIIDKFLKTINSTNKKQHKKNGELESYYVSLTSVHMCKSLIKWGVIPQKTGKEEIHSDILKNEFLRDFLRGYFDGDGITDISKKRSGFVGSEKIINQILEILDENLTTYFSGENKKVKYFLGGKKFSRKLYDYLYKDTNIFLSRKESRLKYIAFNDGTPYEVKVSRTV